MLSVALLSVYRLGARETKHAGPSVIFFTQAVAGLELIQEGVGFF